MNRGMPPKTDGATSEKLVEPAGHPTLGLRLPVFVYHRIAPDSGDRSPELTVSPRQFKSHLEWLSRRGYETVRPSQLEEFRRGRAPNPSKPVLLTFDDAHAALVEHAFPLLREFGFSAAVFVVTAFVGKTNEWDKAAGWGPFPLMGSEEIRAWASRGIEFGAHSRTHPDLRKLSPAELENEIAGSRADLEDLLGAQVSSFAYPYGLWDRAVREIVGKHFQWAFTVQPGINGKQTNNWQLRRTTVYPDDDGRSLRWRVSAGWTPREAVAWLDGKMRRAMGRAKR